MDADERTLPEIIDEATTLLAKFVVPLYESDNRARPLSHASGFFVRASRRHFLVSAGHVLETLKTKPLLDKFISKPDPVDSGISNMVRIEVTG